MVVVRYRDVWKEEGGFTCEHAGEAVVVLSRSGLVLLKLSRISAPGIAFRE